MASKLFWFWSFLFLCIYFQNVVQGRRLQMIDGSMKNGSIFTEEETIEYALDSENSEEKERIEIHNRSHDLAWNKNSSFNHFDVATDMQPFWAILGTFKGTYHSAKAAVSIHPLPQVAYNQESRVAVWVINRGDGSPSSKNVIQAGWHVYPDLYGDNDTHFYVHWAVGASAGCFNLNCEGFVLDKSTDYWPGATPKPLSVYNGDQRFITLKISKDEQTGDWWLYHGPNGDEPVGYWPKSMFTSLQDSATYVQYGGVVRFHADDASPPMGSGHFSKEGKRKAAQLVNIELNGVPYDPNDESFFFDVSDDSCYSITVFKSFEITRRLYFGGPGNCAM